MRMPTKLNGFSGTRSVYLSPLLPFEIRMRYVVSTVSWQLNYIHKNCKETIDVERAVEHNE